MQTEAEKSKLRRIKAYDLGKCINGCGKAYVLPCGLCRECADKRASNKRKWKLKQNKSENRTQCDALEQATACDQLTEFSPLPNKQQNKQTYD